MSYAPSPTTKGPYLLEHGEVWYVTGNATPVGRRIGSDRRHICGPSEKLALAVDPENGTVLKHGAESRVRGWMADFATKVANAKVAAAKIPGAGDVIGADPALLLFDPTAQNLEEINRCIACTGYAARLLDPPSEPLPTPH